jgi:beta-galactosidase
VIKYFCALLLLANFSLSAATNLLRDSTMKWKLVSYKKAKGTLKNLPNGNKNLILSDKNGAGTIMLVNDSRADIPIKPGQSYRISASFQVDKPTVSARLMLSMPGGTRRPFPVSATLSPIGKAGQVSMTFKAAENEKKLRIHFIHKGEPGTLTIHSISLTKLAPFQAEKKNFSKSALLQYWEPFGIRSQKASKNEISGLFGLRGGIICDKINFDAKTVKAIEIDMSVSGDGVRLQLDFIGKYRGKKVSGQLYRSIIPDGKMQTLIFLTGKSSKWRGKIHTLKMNVVSDNGIHLRFKAVRILTEANLIPNAARLAKRGGSRKLKLMRPDSEYEFKWLGKVNPGTQLRLLDSNYQTIKTIDFPKNSVAPLRFKTGLKTMMGIIKLAGKDRGKGYPLLTNISIPNTLPAAWWKASWIWVTGGNEPDGTMWFYRKFKLSEQPTFGEMAFTADDMSEVYVNDKHFPGNKNWRLSDYYDITKALRKGENIIKVRVKDYGSAGGLLMELYMETADGESKRIVSDKKWKCFIGEKAPSRWTLPATELVGPVWGSRMDYRYVGPRVNAEIKNSSKKDFIIKLAKPSPLSTDKLMLKIVSDTGKTLRLPVKVSPGTKDWVPGKETLVNYNFSQDYAMMLSGENFTVSLEIPFLKFTGDTQIYSFKKKPWKATEFPKVSIEGAGKRAWIIVNGKRISPYYYAFPTIFTRKPVENEKILEDAKHTGTQVVRIRYHIMDFKTKPGVRDFSMLDFALSMTKARLPNVKVVLAVPTYMPKWWLKANPDHVKSFYQKNVKYNAYTDYQSMASALWLSDAQKDLTALIKHLQNGPFASMIIAMVPSDGQSYEWIWDNGYGHPGRQHAGFSPAAITTYRKFLKEKYNGDIKKLHKAWGRSDIQFATIMPPIPTRLDNSSLGIMLDPSKDRDIMDFFEFRSEIIAYDILTLCKTIKEETNYKMLTGVYYGYTLMFSRMFNKFQTSGHLRLNKVASSKLVNLFLAPSLYSWRSIGVGTGLMQPSEAITLHGQLPIAELDLRTYAEPDDKEFRSIKVDTVETTFGIMERAFGMILTRGVGAHWLDGKYSCWFSEPILLDLIENQIATYIALPEKTTGKMKADVCMVMDEESPFYVKNNQGDGVHRALIGEFGRKMTDVGVTFDKILLSDLLTPGLVKEHKLYIFNNLLYLDQTQRKAIKERLAKEKASSLWLYAPGVFKQKGQVNAANISSLLGIKTKMDSKTRTWLLKSSPEFGGGIVYPFLKTSPWFLPVSGYDIVAGKSLNGQALVVGKKLSSKQTLWFSAFLNPPVQMLRKMAQQAGARVWSKTYDPVFIGNDFIFLHARTGGTKQLFLPDGIKLEQISGPKTELDDKIQWKAVAGRTYGFKIK